MYDNTVAIEIAKSVQLLWVLCVYVHSVYSVMCAGSWYTGADPGGPSSLANSDILHHIALSYQSSNGLSHVITLEELL